jgi:hypothetical protein
MCAPHMLLIFSPNGPNFTLTAITQYQTYTCKELPELCTPLQGAPVIPIEKMLQLEACLFGQELHALQVLTAQNQTRLTTSINESIERHKMWQIFESTTKTMLLGLCDNLCSYAHAPGCL